MADTFRSALADAAVLTQNYISAALTDQPGTIAQGMVYATQGGKALRAFLVLESAKLHGVTTALPAAAAIECMHAYSLVHDDLPCMDDDALRRGQPTVHVKWDEATAVLVGDALQAMAFDCVLQVNAPADARICLAQTLSVASGVRGMVGGQAADIAAETAQTPLSLHEITALQAGKTGALINWSAMAGARLAQADTDALQKYGDALGLAFQIWDDVLDVIGDADQVGKAVGKDADAGKATFVSLLGLDGAKRRASDLVQEACNALSVYGDDADTLKEAARFVIARTH
jgi:farnesyl diphosphate synthase